MSDKKIHELTVKEAVSSMVNGLSYLRGRLFLLLICGLLFGAIGFLFAFLTPQKYNAKITFLVEDAKSSSGGLAALAGQFGFDIGGGNGGSFLSGDNIPVYFTSELLCREALLTKSDGMSSKTLADVYIEASGLKKKWEKNKKIGKVDFSLYEDRKLPRKEDSLMQVIIRKHILKKDIQVGKPDKKSSFYELSVSMRNEELSQVFAQRLVKIATDKYVESKTKYRVINVDILQKRADSLLNLLNAKTFISASSQQVLVDANPGMKSAPASSEITSREKVTIASIYAEVVKNLEVSKTILNQVTPSVQIVDETTLPLQIQEINYTVTFILFFIFGVIGTIIFLFLKNWIIG